MLRRIFVLTITLLLVSMLAACAQATPAPSEGEPAQPEVEAEEPEQMEPITLRFMSGETDPPSVEAYNEIFAAYEAEHPNVTIELELINADDLHTKIGTLIATGNPPDLAQLDPQQVYPFATEGHLLILDELIDQVGREDFLGGSLFEVNGHVYHMPYAGAGSVNWIRADLFEEYGVKIPTNQAELLDAAEKLTLDTDGDGTIDIYGIALPAGTNKWTGHVFNTAMWQNGQTMFDCDFNVTFDTPETVEALRLYGELTKFSPPGIGGYSYYESIEAIGSGAVAMSPYMGRTLSWIAQNSPDLLDKIKAIPLVFFDENNANYGGWNVYTVFSASKHPEEAKDFLAYLTTDDNAALFSRTAQGHLVPPTYSLLASELLWEDELMQSRKEDVDLVFEMANSSLHPAYEACSIAADGSLSGTSMLNPYMGAIIAQNVRATAVQMVVLDGKSPEEAAAWGQAEMERIIAEYE